jgi:P-type Cu+ transporter
MSEKESSTARTSVGPLNHDREDWTSTRILISNIHCPSCSRAITRILHDFFKAELRDVSTSVVSQTVSFRHQTPFDPVQVVKVLYDAGFDSDAIEQSDGSGHYRLGDAWTSTPHSTAAVDKALRRDFSALTYSLLPEPKGLQDRKAAHVAQCNACQKEGHDEASGLICHASQPAQQTHEEKIDIVIDAEKQQESWAAVYSIEGMSCASCVAAITRALDDLACVDEANVNLMSASASVRFTGDRVLVEQIKTEIEDAGFDATLQAVESQGCAKDLVQTLERTILIKVSGMYCAHCPPRVVAAINEAFAASVRVEDGFALQSCILRVTYKPNPPQHTIRDIISCVESASPAFGAAVYHPPTLEDRARAMQMRHRRHILYRLALSITIAIPTFVLGVVYMSLMPEDNNARQYLEGSVPRTSISRLQLALFVLATPVYFFAADRFHRRAIEELYVLWRPSSKVPILRRFYRFGSMDVLLCFGTSVAYFGSVAQLAISAATTSPQVTGGSTTYFDAVVFLTMFLLAGRLIEAYSKSKAGDAVSSLGKLRSSEAQLLVCDQSIRLPADQLENGDLVRVVAGASPPCDGIVHHGEASFNESSLTGESKVVAKKIGDAVFAGTVNTTNPVTVQVTGVGMSLLDQIIDAVREGQARRAPIERIADVITGYFAPAITMTAIVIWILWLSLGYSGRLPAAYMDNRMGGWAYWALEFAIAVFVVACPCGIGLAAPTALFVGSGLAAKHGILVKGGGEAMQEASQLDVIVFDKTGTITEGDNPSVTDVLVISGTNTAQCLRAVKTLESNSSHPIAAALIKYCERQGVGDAMTTEQIDDIPGRGLRGQFTLDDATVMDIAVGNEALMTVHNLDIPPPVAVKLEEWKAQGKSVVLIGVRTTPANDSIERDGTWSLAMMLSISDPPRQEASWVIKSLRTLGIDVWMLSGDNEKTARSVAAVVGIPEENVIANVLPQEKAQQISILQRSLKKRRKRYVFFGKEYELAQQRATVAMVGDGINDAAALTTADFGVAMGSGADTAIASADFVLIKSDLNSILLLIELSRSVFNRVKLNFAWAMGYNLVALPIAAGALYAVVSNGSHVRLDPVWASLAMALSSVSVVTSSLLLRTTLPLLGFRPTAQK